jgi:hypothetical protein
MKRVSVYIAGLAVCALVLSINIAQVRPPLKHGDRSFAPDHQVRIYADVVPGLSSVRL